jgi:vanillate O-demethylase ferredoxin subunit
MAGTPAMIEVTVHGRRQEADGVVSLDLRATTGALPRFSAGSHIDVAVPLPAGPVLRQYSLCNDPAEAHRYVIGVGRDAASRGGSAWLCEQVAEGDRLRISAPRNHFPLDEAAPHSVLVAGGIGITPMLAMARRLSALGRSWTLYVCAATPARAAFLAEAQRLPGQVVPVFDGLAGVASLDLRAVAAAALPDTHLYCCGPGPMLHAFEAACAGRPAGTVHLEWFKAPETALAVVNGERAFDLQLARSGQRLQVPVGTSILDVLLAAGIDVAHSCCDGVCGSCETRVLAGRPDHRDAVLLGPDAQAQDRIMVCVSRCRDALLTLDL